MILKSLTLKNYRRFKNLKIDFEENITAFIGKNGSGKTTIFEAILYALFGTQMATRTSKEDIKSDFADQKQKCKVCLTFELEGKQYRIERCIKGKNSITSAFIFTPEKGDKPIAERESGVNEFIQKLLGMNADTFKISVFSAQKELDKFSSLQAEKRKEEIRRLLNIDVIKSAITLLRRDIRENEAKIEALKSQQKDTKEIKNNICQLKSDLAEQKLSLKKLIFSSQQLKSKLEKQKVKVKTLEKLSQTAHKLDKQIVGFKSNLKAVKESITQETDKIIDLTKKQKQLVKVFPVKKKVQKARQEKKLFDDNKEKYQQVKILKDQLTGEKKNKNQLSQALTEIKKKIKELLPFEERGKIVKKQLDKIEEKIKSKNHKLTELEQQGKSLKSKREETNQKLAKIKKLGKKSPCPTCTRTLDEYYDDLVQKFTQEVRGIQKQIDDKRKEYQKIKIDKQTLIKQKEALNEQIEKIEKGLNQLNIFKTKRESIADQIIKSSSKIKTLINQINQLGKIKFDSEKYQQFIQKFKLLEKQNESVIKLETEVKQLPKAQEAKNQFLEKQKLLAIQLTKAVAERNSLNFNENEFNQEREKQDQIQEENEAIVKKLAQNKGNIQTIKVDLKNNQEKFKEQKELEKEIKNLLKGNKNLAGLEPLLQEFETDLLARIRPILEKETGSLLQIISQGKYPDVELDSSYEISVYDKGEKYKIKRFSGGEEDLINLCLRLAISRVIAEKSGGKKINFLILDEIFASQDEERQRNILQALQGLSTQFRQLFLITHVTSIKDKMPFVYEVLEVNKNKSQVKLLK